MTPGFNAGLGMRQSYYTATAAEPPTTGPLTEAIDADVVVIGGGCTGLAAARRAALAGRSVILLEGGAIGWGASGRNGGQMIPGLRMRATDLVRNYGKDHARQLFALAISARDEVVGLIERENIACDLRTTGHLGAALKAADLDDMRAEVACLNEVMDYHEAELLDAAAMADEVAHPYVGGLLDRGGGHLHPLNYTLGLARSAIAAGVRIYSNTPVINVDRERGTVIARTSAGQVQAGACILAGDALLGQVDRQLSHYIMPIANYIAATRPLGDPASLISHDRAISDSRFVVNYYRRSADGRLIFGGGERYTTRPPSDMSGFVRPFMERAFPQLRGIEIDYAWGGLVSVTRTRLPHIGRDGPILWAHGYSGMGTILSSLAGRLLGDAIDGNETELDQFASIAPPPFPGGSALRAPLHTLAMLWFSMRDRLGF